MYSWWFRNPASGDHVYKILLSSSRALFSTSMMMDDEFGGISEASTVWMNGQLFSMARSFAVSVLFSSFPCVACLRGGRDRWDHQICFQEFSSTNDNAVEKAWWLTILGIPQFLCLIQEKSYSLGDPRIFPSICRESTGWGFTNLRELVVTFHKEPVASRIALFGRGHLGGM